MTVELFPGVKLTPPVLLHQALEEVGDARAVLLVTMNADETVDVSMSCMSLRDLSFMQLKVQLFVADMVSNEPPEGTRTFIPVPP